MRILFLSYDGLTDPLGQSQVIPYLSGLSGKGNEITIVSCEKKARYRSTEDEIRQTLNRAGIQWHPLPYRKWPPVLSTILDIRSMVRKGRAMQRINSYHIVHCRGYITAFTGLYLKRKFGVRFIFDMRAFFADERVEGGLWKRNNLLFNWVYLYFKKKEKQFIQAADRVITLTKKGKAIIRSWPGLNATNHISVIPCCADFRLFDRSVHSKVQLPELQHAELVISYLGSVGTWYMLDEMLAFFTRVKIKYPGARLLFISGDDPHEIKRRAQNLHLDPDDIVVKQAARDQVPAYLRASDISLFFIKPVFSKQASSPTKMGEIMAMGMPFICNAGVGDVDEIVNDTIGGMLVNRFTNVDYDLAVNRIEEILNIPPEEIRQQGMRYYSLDAGIELYASVYQDIM